MRERSLEGLRAGSLPRVDVGDSVREKVFDSCGGPISVRVNVLGEPVLPVIRVVEKHQSAAVSSVINSHDPKLWPF